MNVGADKDSQRIRPWYGGILTPPSLHHDRHIETQHERQRNEITIRRAIFDNTFEYSEAENDTRN